MYVLGSSINYVVSVGGGSPKDDLLHRPYLIKKVTRGVRRGSKIADFEVT
jgi:hypothetical protein